jgi:hypothetical protein
MTRTPRRRLRATERWTRDSGPRECVDKVKAAPLPRQMYHVSLWLALWGCGRQRLSQWSREHASASANGSVSTMSAGRQDTVRERTPPPGLLHLKIKINWLAAFRKTRRFSVFGDRDELNLTTEITASLFCAVNSVVAALTPSVAPTRRSRSDAELEKWLPVVFSDHLIVASRRSPEAFC